MARTGIPWRYLSHDFPHRNSVYHYFGRWERDGIFEHLNALLRRRVREEEGRSPEPTGSVIDAQSVKTSTNIPAREQGADVGKRIVGRKRSIIIHTTGLMLTVPVTAASIQDSVAGERLLNRLAANHPGIRKGWADRGYREYLVDHAARLGIDLDVVRRAPGTKGFKVLPRRWVVERRLGWLMHLPPFGPGLRSPPCPLHRMICIAMIAFMTRRLTHESTPTWRGA
ncbi:transposase [Streptomyces sp. V3I8]|nr:transposase [Streptomyces sp. V3I8]